MTTLTLQHLLDEAQIFAATAYPRESVILAVLAGLHRSGNKDALPVATRPSRQNFANNEIKNWLRNAKRHCKRRSWMNQTYPKGD